MKNISMTLWRASALAACMAATVYAQGQAPASTKTLSPVDRYDYIVSTQVIGGFHQINPSPKPLLVDGAEQILGMGSPIIKFAITPRYAENGYAAKRDPSVTSLTQLAQVPSYKQVFDMPFSRYILWTYTFSTDYKLWPWHGHMKQETLDAEYKEMYEFTKYLLTAYNGTGKTFYLGNWEGDWHLIAGAPKAKYKWLTDPNADAPQGMIDWLSIRQKAIDDAKRDTPHKDVQVYFYVECNLVQKSIKEGKASVAKSVLPFVNPDFVSYSSYDSTNPDKDLHHDLPAALDYMQAQLKPKPGLPEKRVFVGEYTSTREEFDALGQDAHMRDIIATSVQWGTPFVLYWELYNNVIDPDGTLQGCWLIDDHGVKQPAYFTYQNFDKDARAYVAATLKKTGSVPSAADFQSYTYKWFTNPATLPKATPEWKAAIRFRKAPAAAAPTVAK
jgi:hypothetical protein